MKDKTTYLVQVALKDLGFDPGPLDGDRGPRTNAAQAEWEASLAPKPFSLFDERTEKNIATLQPMAQRIFRPFVAAAIATALKHGIELKVICGLRNKTDQNHALARGASKAGYGWSWHNYGMAIDFGCFDGGSYLDAAEPARAEKLYKELGILAAKHEISWGGFWRSFKDTPHFQPAYLPTSPSYRYRKELNDGSWSAP